MIHIIGGGIIGLCSAWYLTEQGHEVTIVDKNNFTDGASFGNAGMIVPSHFVPMAAPGVITQGLKWLLNSKSPFYIKPRLDADLMQWLWHFLRSSNTKQVEKAMPVLLAFQEWSKQLYQDFAAHSDFDFGFEKRGLLMLYKTAKQAEEEAELAQKAQQLGLKAEILDAAGLKKLEPEMQFDVLGGIYFPGDAHCCPNQFMQELIRNLKAKGVRFVDGQSIKNFEIKGNKITTLKNHFGQSISVENVLLTSGTWTGKLLKKLGIKIHLQDGKGYSITLKKSQLRPQIPTILAEAKVAITPMGNDLRIGGTLEMSGLSPKINQARVKGILESIPNYYQNLPIPELPSLNVWKGYRPCTPDGMPYIGKSTKIENLTVATGHGMMGLSLGPATGKLVSQLFDKEATGILTDLFQLDRF